MNNLNTEDYELLNQVTYCLFGDTYSDEQYNKLLRTFPELFSAIKSKDFYVLMEGYCNIFVGMKFPNSTDTEEYKKEFGHKVDDSKDNFHKSIGVYVYMYSHEKQLAAKFLKIAADKFSNHGCNDVDDSFFEGWTTEKRQEFVKEYYEYNGTPEDYDENHLHLPDWCIMSFLAYKLENNIWH